MYMCVYMQPVLPGHIVGNSLKDTQGTHTKHPSLHLQAVIDHENGYMQSKETVDVYCTREPQSVYHQRISFCLDIHNQSVKAMRYPPKSYNKDLESAEVSIIFSSLLI